MVTPNPLSNSYRKLLPNFLLSSGCALLLSGCLGSTPSPATGTAGQVPIEDHSSTRTGASNPPYPTEDNADTTNSQQPTRINTGKEQVTLALLEQSTAATNAGNHQQAITYVERAIRIKPRQADLWVQLAQLQLSIDKPNAAQDYARKAITLAGGRMDWVRDAWLVIAQAKEAQGLTQEASAIRQRWQTGRG